MPAELSKTGLIVQVSMGKRAQRAVRAALVVHLLIHSFGVTVLYPPGGSHNHMLCRDAPDPDVEGL